MGFLLMKDRPASVKLSIFGLDQHPDPQSFTDCIKRLNGVVDARLDSRKNIVKVKWKPESPLTKDDVISAVFSFGIAAEELA